MKVILFLISILFLNYLCAFAQQEMDYFKFPTEIDIIYDICFTQNGDAIAIADNKSIKVYSTDSIKLLTEFKNGHRDQILSIDISGDSTYLISGGKDSTFVIWDFKQGGRLKSIKCNGIINSVCLSPDNLYAVFGGTDKQVYVYDFLKEELISVDSKHTNDITSVAFSPDGRYFATSSGDKNIHIYEKGKLTATLSDHKNWVRDIAFSTSDSRLISCDDNGFAILWNTSNINNPSLSDKSWFGFNWLLSIDFHNDGKTYAVGNVNGKAIIVGKYCKYIANVKSPVNRILFKPNEIYFKVAVATRGKGVLFINSNNMKYVNN